PPALRQGRQPPRRAECRAGRLAAPRAVRRRRRAARRPGALRRGAPRPPARGQGAAARGAGRGERGQAEGVHPLVAPPLRQGRLGDLPGADLLMSVAALGHLKLLDLSRQLPGPFCSTLLADLGMDVLVVAAPQAPFGVGIPFLARNKRSMTLNLKHAAGRDVFLRLAAEADVVLEGFRPGVTARLGIDYPTLAAVNPRLVYCSISGYGQDGPYRERVGHDINYLGYAGVLEFIGREGGPPVIPGVQIAYIGGGAQMAAIGILAGVIAAERSGHGQHVDIAMCDGAFAWNVY